MGRGQTSRSRTHDRDSLFPGSLYRSKHRKVFADIAHETLDRADSKAIVNLTPLASSLARVVTDPPAHARKRALFSNESKGSFEVTLLDGADIAFHIDIEGASSLTRGDFNTPRQTPEFVNLSEKKFLHNRKSSPKARHSCS